jgi:hypothetical protein
LLRTIENLNKITDHKSEVDKRKKSVGPRVEDAIEKQTHNVAVAGRVRQLPNTVDIQHGDLNEEMSARRETEYNVLQEDKLSVLKRRPWINKPIEELTDLVSDDRTGEYMHIAVSTYSHIIYCTNIGDAIYMLANILGPFHYYFKFQSRKRFPTLC